MLENQLLNEFKEFNERRLVSEWNDESKGTWELFYLASCGDEFFRTHDMFRKEIVNSYPERYENNSVMIMNSDYYEHFFEFYNTRVSNDNKQNLIRFGACKVKTIPFLLSNFELTESFSTHNDFHAMHYNEQMLEKNVQYVWLLFKWFRIKKETKE